MEQDRYEIVIAVRDTTTGDYRDVRFIISSNDYPTDMFNLLTAEARLVVDDLDDEADREEEARADRVARFTRGE